MFPSLFFIRTFRDIIFECIDANQLMSRNGKARTCAIQLFFDNNQTKIKWKLNETSFTRFA